MLNIHISIYACRDLCLCVHPLSLSSCVYVRCTYVPSERERDRDLERSTESERVRERASEGVERVRE